MRLDRGSPAEMAETERLASLAVQFGRHDAVALAVAGLGLGYVASDLEGALALVDRALALNLNLATAWYVAIEHLGRAMRLSRHDPLIFTMQGVTAFTQLLADLLKRRGHGLKRPCGSDRTSSPRCAFWLPAMRWMDD